MFSALCVNNKNISSHLWPYRHIQRLRSRFILTALVFGQEINETFWVPPLIPNCPFKQVGTCSFCLFEKLSIIPIINKNAINTRTNNCLSRQNQETEGGKWVPNQIPGNLLMPLGPALLWLLGRAWVMFYFRSENHGV